MENRGSTIGASEQSEKRIRKDSIREVGLIFKTDYGSQRVWIKQQSCTWKKNTNKLSSQYYLITTRLQEKSFCYVSIALFQITLFKHYWIQLFKGKSIGFSNIWVHCLTIMNKLKMLSAFEVPPNKKHDSHSPFPKPIQANLLLWSRTHCLSLLVFFF